MIWTDYYCHRYFGGKAHSLLAISTDFVKPKHYERKPTYKFKMSTTKNPSGAFGFPKRGCCEVSSCMFHRVSQQHSCLLSSSFHYRKWVCSQMQSCHPSGWHIIPVNSCEDGAVLVPDSAAAAMPCLGHHLSRWPWCHRKQRATNFASKCSHFAELHLLKRTCRFFILASCLATYCDL